MQKQQKTAGIFYTKRWEKSLQMERKAITMRVVRRRTALFFLRTSSGRKRPVIIRISMQRITANTLLTKNIWMEVTMQQENYPHFCAAVCGAIRGRLGAEYEVSLHSVMKNNSVRLESLLIRKAQTLVMPAIYLNDFFEEYQNGKEWEAILSDILQSYEKNRLSCEERISFRYEDLKEHIFYRLVNYERNRESLEVMPYYRVGGCAIIFQCMIFSGEKRMGTIRLTQQHLEIWGVSQEEVFARACANTARLLPPSLRPMDEVMEEILWEGLGRSVKEDDPAEATEAAIQRILTRRNAPLPMYVLSNRRGSFGASALLEVRLLDSFAKAIADDFYILPSSVHEVLLLPLRFAPEAEKIEAMVREINETQIPETEYLSDDVLLYSEFRALLPERLLPQEA